MSNNLLLTPPEVVSSPIYFTTDESEVGTFIGDHMSSASSSFEGFDISDKSLQIYPNIATPSQIINENNTYEKVKKVDTVFDEKSDSGYNETIPKQFIGPSGNSKCIAAVAESQGKRATGSDQHKVMKINKELFTEVNTQGLNNFSVDFGMVEDISSCETSLNYSPHYPSKGAPPSVSQGCDSGLLNQKTVLQSPTNIAKGFDNKSDSLSNNSVAKDTRLCTITERTETITDRSSMTQTDCRSDKQTETILLKTQTDNNSNLQQTEAMDLKLILQMMNKMNENVTSLKSEVQSGINLQSGKLDSLQNSFVEFKGDVEQCKAEVIGLRQEVCENVHQVGLMSTEILKNSNDILKLKQESTQLETALTERLINNNLHVESRIEIIKGEVNHSKVLVNEISNILQNSKIELEELKGKYLVLEGAVINNRDHGIQLNHNLVGLANHMLNGSSTDPMMVKTLLQQIHPPNASPFTPKQTLSVNKDAVENSRTSISSSPLVSPSYVMPNAIINQGPQLGLPPPYQLGRLTEEEFILKGIFKKEKIPSFDGSNISAPQFIEESEVYFALVNIANDKNKVKVISSFMKGVALQWWKRISKDINSWEEAKKEILEQYFSDYNRQKFKLEWKKHEYHKTKDIEQFVLQAFHLLDIVKPKYTFKKKCQAVASRLPPSLMTFLLPTEFQSEKDFMNVLKDAMTLTNFKNDASTGISTNNQVNLPVNSNTSNSGHNSGNTMNNNNNSTNNNNVITNPNYRGKPANFDPNYRHNFGNQQNWNNYNNQGNGQGQNGGSGNFRGRSWYNNSRNGHGRRPYYPNRGNGGNHNQQSGNNQPSTTPNGGNGKTSNQVGVSNVAATPPPAPVPSTTMTAQTTSGQAPANVSGNSQDTVYMSAALFNQLFVQNYIPSTPPTGDGLIQPSQLPSN